MKTKVIFSKEKLYKGVETLAEAVGSTLGPKGQSVLILTDQGPRITKDGVTVAGYIDLKDQEEWAGSKVVSESARATVDSAGDGTTTSIILANEIIKNAKDIEGTVDAIKGIHTASLDVLRELEGRTKELTPEMIKHIAYVATNNDKDLSEIVSEAFIESGDDGIVDVAVTPHQSDVTLDIRPGSFVHSGFKNSSFINNEKTRTLELGESDILVSTLTIDDHRKILHLLEHAIKSKRPLILIAETGQEFDEAFMMNIAKKNLTGCIINPGGMITSEGIKDLAKLVNATYFDNSHGNNLSHVKVSDLGQVDKATISETFSLFTVDNPGDVSGNVENLKAQIEKSDNEFSKRDLKARLSMLSGKYATIKVGAPTMSALGEIKDRIDDAVFAVGAAQKHGYLPGGGVCLRDISNTLKTKEATTCFEKGKEALLTAIIAPYNKILSNAGLKPNDSLKEGFGIDASSGKEVDMVKAGIIDPSFVTVQAVVNATSSATALLSTNATIIKEIEDGI